MKLYKHGLAVFVKNKILITCLIAGAMLSLARLFYDYYLWNDIIIKPLETTLSLSPYLFIIFLILTYEYFVQVKLADLEETFLSTPYGRRRSYLFSQLMVIWTFTIFYVMLLFVCNIILFIITTKHFGWETFDYTYSKHIMHNLLVNVFLLCILASLVGVVVSTIQRRRVAYLVILIIIYLSSSFVEIIADTLALTGVGNIYPIRELVNVMPINLDFSPNYMFGFSILPYRICLMVFWSLFCLFIVFLKVPKSKLLKSIIAALCLTSLIVYCLPSSKVIMNNNINGSALGDQWYYERYYNKRLISKNERPNYHIKGYKMNIDIGRMLTADVAMDIDKPLLNEYKMTLYHDYKVSKVTDQKGEQLDFSQQGDYITIKRGIRPVKKLLITYKGYSAKYYSNYQGTCLPGNFVYYPRAGFYRLGENNNNGWISLFHNTNVQFDVRIKNQKKIYTNLDEVGKNHFVGKSNGVTIMSGFLKEVEAGGIRYIYPYLEDSIEDGKNLTQRISMGIYSLQKLGYADCTVFIMPNLNTVRGGIMSKSQILSCWPYEDFADLKEELSQDI